MLLCAVLCILERLLGDGFVNGHHLVLVGVTRVYLPLLTWLFSFHWESLVNLLEVIEHCGTMSVLSAFWACQVLGYIQRIWPMRSASSMGPTFLVVVVA